MSLVKKFNNFVKVVSDLKSNKIDGLAFWRDYKKDLMKYDNLSTGLDYTVDKEYIKKINNLFNAGYLLNKDINGETVLPDHFIYQLANIPTSEPLNVRRVMQLALNIGQWKAAIKNTEGLFLADKIFNEYNLENIESYLKKEDIEVLSELLG